MLQDLKDVHIFWSCTLRSHRIVQVSQTRSSGILIASEFEVPPQVETLNNIFVSYQNRRQNLKETLSAALAKSAIFAAH